MPSPADQVAQPLFAAWVLAIGYIWRPVPSLTAWLALTLFVNTWAHYRTPAMLHLDEAFLPMLFLLALVRHAIPAHRIELGFREWAVGLFILAGLVSSLASQVPPYVFGAALVLLLKAIAVYYVVSWTTMSLDEVERAGKVMLGVAGVTVALGLLEFIDPQAMRGALGLPNIASERGGTGVVTSLFVQPGLFGWFTAFMSLFLYARYLVYRRWWTLAFALLLNVGTILSGRRRPLIGVVTAFLVALVWQWRQAASLRGTLRGALPLFASAVLLLAVSAPLFGTFYGSTVAAYVPRTDTIQVLAFGDGQLTDEQAASVQPRVALYAASIAVAADHFPLGAGFGRYGSPMSRVVYSPAYEQYGISRVYGLRQNNPSAVTDTFWPMLLGETGVLGMGAYAAFVGALVVGAWRAAGSVESRRQRALSLGVVMALILGLVESTVAPTFQAAPVAYFLLASAGLIPNVCSARRAPS